MSVSVNFIFGTDKESAVEIRQFRDVQYVPKVGEFVSVTSTRDVDGDYVFEFPQPVMKGCVTKVSYSYDEYGKSGGDRDSVQIVDIFIESTDKAGLSRC